MARLSPTQLTWTLGIEIIFCIFKKGNLLKYLVLNEGCNFPTLWTHYAKVLIFREYQTVHPLQTPLANEVASSTMQT